MIYFIECDGYVKIGYTTQLNRRVKSFATSNPHPVKLLASAPGNVEDEQELHKRFRELHHRGEWFRKTPELLAGIKAACGQLVDKDAAFRKERPVIGSNEYMDIIARDLGLSETEKQFAIKLAQLSGGGRRNERHQ